jgi:cytochrome c-type biogenesis protein CcmH
MKKRSYFVLLILLMMSLPSYAVIETYDFSNENYQKRYQIMVDELRCPKCQNQNLSGSNSPIAKDLRRELHRMIEQGDDDEFIKAFMVKRYGNFVLYRPPLDKNTFILWGLPILLVFGALIIVLIYRLRLVSADIAEALSDTEKLQLEKILEEYSH